MHNTFDNNIDPVETFSTVQTGTGKTTIPVISFSAWSGTGKTTIIEQVVAKLKQPGFRVAVIKHDAHDFEIDKEGKDSWRFTKAGADITVINSANKTALIEQRSLNLSEILSMIHDVDLILLEGYNADGCNEKNRNMESCNTEICYTKSCNPGGCNTEGCSMEDCSKKDYYYENILRIGISRKSTGKGFRQPPDSYAAVITDEKIDLSVPVFALDDIDGITDYILKIL